MSMSLAGMVEQVMTPSWWQFMESTRASRSSNMEAFQRRFDAHMLDKSGQTVSVTQIVKELNASDKAVKRELIGMVEDGSAEIVEVGKLKLYRIK